MEINEFVDKLMDQASLDAIDFASDVERILAEQVVFLRAQLETVRREAVVGAHAVIDALYARIGDKDAQVATLEKEVGFLRQHFSA
jgi:hypothetical protein